ncbi:Ribokinase [Nymphon striatum]|nr:Ribokinase [Nymphon striatum]
MMENVNRIISFGGLVTDLISYGSRFPKPGETFTGHRFEIGHGGKGGNGCVAATRLGATTSMIGKVGDDYFGESYLKSLKENGVNTGKLYVKGLRRTLVDILDEHIHNHCTFKVSSSYFKCSGNLALSYHVSIAKNSTTSTANIIVTDQGQNSIMFVPGATALITEDEILQAEKILRGAITTVVNAAPILPNVVPEIYELCDLLVVNETEAEFYSGIAVSSVADAENSIHKFLKKGCNRVIVTLGEAGAVCGSDGDMFHVPTRKVTPIDSTGAGDAFVGGLIYYMAEHNNLAFKEMIRRSYDHSVDDEYDFPEIAQKFHLKRFEVAIHKLTDIAIPFHLELLQKHKGNIEKRLSEWVKLEKEVINASRTVQHPDQVQVEKQAQLPPHNSKLTYSWLDLKKAAKLKMAVGPVAGAVIGFGAGGPVGLFLGLKVGMAAALGASVVAGKIIKSRQAKVTDLEMEKISPAMNRSTSLPEQSSGCRGKLESCNDSDGFSGLMSGVSTVLLENRQRFTRLVRWNCEQRKNFGNLLYLDDDEQV